MSYRVRVKSPSKVKVSLGSTGINVKVKNGEPMAQKFEDLANVDVSNVNNGYIIMYNAATQKYTAIDPDAVLVASASTSIGQPGIPAEFLDSLDVDLDNRIDVDAGTF